MATTKLEDLFVPPVYASMFAESRPDNIALVQSGAVVTDPIFQSLLGQNGRVGTLPFYKPLNGDDASLSSDDPSDVMVPGKVSTGVQTFVLHSLNKGYEFADFAVERSSGNAMQNAREAFEEWWQHHLQDRIIATLKGVMNSDLASGSPQLVNDIFSSGAAPVDGNRFSRDALIDTTTLMGDRADDIQMMLVHPIVYGRLAKQDAISHYKDSETGMPQTYFDGRIRLISSRAAPAEQINGHNVYTTILLGSGAIRYGNLPGLQVPFELTREPLQGGGRGITTLIERLDWCVHPVGHAWGIEQLNPTISSLEVADNWTRVYDPQNVAIRYLRTN